MIQYILKTKFNNNVFLDFCVATKMEVQEHNKLK